MRPETSASLKAGIVAGACFGLASTILIIIFTLPYLAEITAQIANQYSSLPPNTMPKITENDILKVTVAFVLPLAAILAMLPGAIFGFLYIKTVHHMSVPSTRLKAILFGFVLWLFPFAIGVWATPSIEIMTASAFLGLLLLIILADAILFAFAFDRFSKPSIAKLPKPIPEPLSFLFKPRTLALFYAVAIGGFLCIVAWRMMQLLPQLSSDLRAQLSLLAFIGIAIIFLYSLTYLTQYLRPKSRKPI